MAEAALTQRNAMTTDTKTRRGRKSKNDAEIRVRLDTKTKGNAARLFKRYGLTTSDGVRLLLNRAIAEKELPSTPNAETQKAMNDVLSGRTERVSLDDIKKRFLGDQ